MALHVNAHMNESKVPADFTPDPYADYAALLSPAFMPSAHANTLVLATNDPSDRQTDLTSPMKRIEYDLEEVSRRIDELVRTRTPDFLMELGGKKCRGID